MKICYSSLTDKGITRDHNEDSFLNSENFGFFIVADGMGGYQCGDMASKSALAAINGSLMEFSPDGKTFTAKMFEKAISIANKMVFFLSHVDREIKKTGTTMVAFLPAGTEGVAYNIGDSRLYQFRDNELTQITKDHSAESELPDFMQGLGGGKFSSVLSKALGGTQDAEADRYDFPIQENDIFLLCSDGLYSMVDDIEITKIIKSQKKTLEERCRMLIDLANKNGGEDNITATLVQLTETDTPSFPEFINIS